MKKLDLLRNVLVGGVVAIGSAYATRGALDNYFPDSQQGSPTHSYSINADNQNSSDVEHDDVVIGYENGDVEVYLRGLGGNFTSAESFRTRDLNKVDKSRERRLGELEDWYSSQMDDIESNFAGIREQLK